MDHLPATATVGTPPALSLEREFAADFQLVVNYLCRLTDDPRLAGGLACEAFRRVQARRPEDPGTSRLEVLRVATELSRRTLQPRGILRRRHRPAIDLAGFPNAEARRVLKRDTTQRALAALPFESRAVILLRDLLKLTYVELAQVLGIPIRKLIQTLDRSRGELAEIYAYIKF
jgi:DNA-directed RNA polymerase specialized sigma24 family protein